MAERLAAEHAAAERISELTTGIRRCVDMLKRIDPQTQPTLYRRVDGELRRKRAQLKRLQS